MKQGIAEGTPPVTEAKSLLFNHSTSDSPNLQPDVSYKVDLSRSL